MDKPKRIAKGHVIDGSVYVCLSVSMPPNLFAAVREKAERESRSFSNMLSVLAKRGLKAENDHQQ